MYYANFAYANFTRTKYARDKKKRKKRLRKLFLAGLAGMGMVAGYGIPVLLSKGKKKSRPLVTTVNSKEPVFKLVDKTPTQPILDLPSIPLITHKTPVDKIPVVAKDNKKAILNLLQDVQIAYGNPTRKEVRLHLASNRTPEFSALVKKAIKANKYKKYLRQARNRNLSKDIRRWYLREARKLKPRKNNLGNPVEELKQYVESKIKDSKAKPLSGKNSQYGNASPAVRKRLVELRREKIQAENDNLFNGENTSPFFSKLFEGLTGKKPNSSKMSAKVYYDGDSYIENHTGKYNFLVKPPKGETVDNRLGRHYYANRASSNARQKYGAEYSTKLYHLADFSLL